MNIKKILLPYLDSNNTNAKIIKIYFKNKDHIKKDSIIFEMETNKIVSELLSEHTGFIELKCKEGDTIEFGQIVALIHDNDEFHEEEYSQDININKNDYRLTTKAREYIKKNHIDITNIKFNKKIIKTEDIINHFKNSDQSISLNDAIKSRVAETVKKSKASIPHAYMNIKLKFNKLLIDNCEILDLIIYSHLQIIVNHKNLINQSQDPKSLFFAVDKDENLFMLKMKLSNENKDTINSTRKKLILDLYRTGYQGNSEIIPSISFSSLENTEIDFQVPILMPNTLLILGLGGKVIDGDIININLTASYDHSKINGAQIANYLTELKGYINDIK